MPRIPPLTLTMLPLPPCPPSEAVKTPPDVDDETAPKGQACKLRAMFEERAAAAATAAVRVPSQRRPSPHPTRAPVAQVDAEADLDRKPHPPAHSMQVSVERPQVLS